MNEALAIIGVIAGLVGAMSGVAAFARVRTQNHADRADAAESMSAAASALIEPLRVELAALRVKVAGLERENRFLRLWATRLVEQVKCAGLVPVPYEESE